MKNNPAQEYSYNTHPRNLYKDNLLSVSQVIKIAKKQGFDFGKGNPYNRLRYYIKIGLLPHMRRKRKNSKSSSTCGYYPAWIIDRLLTIQELKNQGYSTKLILEKSNSSQDHSLQGIKTTFQKLLKIASFGLFSLILLIVIALSYTQIIPAAPSKKTQIFRDQTGDRSPEKTAASSEDKQHKTDPLQFDKDPLGSTEVQKTLYETTFEPYKETELSTIPLNNQRKEAEKAKANDFSNKENYKTSSITDAYKLNESINQGAVDQTIKINILNAHSNPVAGTYWDVLFTTQGTADLTIIPADQATVEDMEFTFLKCGLEEKKPQLLSGDIVYYPNWLCNEIATVSHYVLKTGKHHLIFKFGDKKVHAYNAAKSWDGGAGTSNWEDGNNWNPDGAPDNTDDVTIDSNVTVNINGATTINSLTLGNSGGTTSPTLNFAYNAISSGALVIDDGNLTVYSNATATHTQGTASVVGTIFINVQTGSATINGSINLNSKGYQGAAGPGAGAYNYDDASGAAYGGDGGDGVPAGGTAYGSVTAPTDLGSGGGNNANYSGGRGGGAAKLTIAGTITISGSITANGANGQCYAGQRGEGGGAGGSIYITTGTLAGNGSVRADGGTATCDAGAGGGGRIAIVDYTSDTSSLTLTAYGGSASSRSGGAGTIYKKASGTNGALTIDNTNLNTYSDDRYAGRTPLNTTYTFDTITVQNYGNLETGSSANVTYTTLTWSNKGVITDNGGAFSLLSGGGDLTVPSTAYLFGNTTRTFNSITISGTLTHSNNKTTEQYTLNYTSNNNLTVNTGGAINVNGRGYQNSEGTGAGTDGGDDGGGGGYGGTGGASAGGQSGGSTYGSATAPTNIGSGGGNGNNGGLAGGFGGGAIRLIITGTITATGNITANGGNGGTYFWRASGGGSGGSAYITTETLAGTCSNITANGGTASVSEGGGGGGGGRIALYFSSKTCSGTATVTGGTGYNNGSDGTLYEEETDGSTNEELNYQGKLTDQNYDAVSDGEYQMTFKIYNTATGTTAIYDEFWTDANTCNTTINGSPTGGTTTTVPYTESAGNCATHGTESSWQVGQIVCNLTDKTCAEITAVNTSGNTITVAGNMTTSPFSWANGETITNQPAVINGIFNVRIGSLNPSGDPLTNINFNQDLWLGVTVESDSEMRPRRKFASVPAAHTADKLDNIDSTSFLRSDTSDSFTSGTLTIGSGATLSVSGSLSCTDCISLGSETTGTYVGDVSGTNGITVSGTQGEGYTETVKLGGTLTESTSIAQANYDMIFNLSGTGDFRVQDNGTDVLFVKDDGNVGIGTTGPQKNLHVSGAGAAIGLSNTSNGVDLKNWQINIDSTYGNLNFWQSNDTWTGNGLGPVFDRSNGGLALGYFDAGNAALAVDGKVGIGTTFATGAPDDKLTVAGGSGTIYNTASLDSEKVTNGLFTDSSAWTWGTGWTHDAVNLEADHTAGNTAALEQNVSAVSGEIYQVVFTVLNTTAGSVTPQVGGVNGAAVSSNSTSTQQIRATGTGNLKFIPSTDFDGSVDTVSVKLITGGDLKLAGLLTGGGTTGIKVTAAGNIGIGTTNPSYKLDLYDDAVSADESIQKIDLGEAGTTGEYFLLMRSNTDSSADIEFKFETGGTAYADGSWTGSGADVAEIMPTSEKDLEPGDLVGIADNEIFSIAKTTIPYDPKLIGVISENPGLVTGAGDTNSPNEGVKVALAGRVKVKVALENGEIKAGDYITAASFSGYGMKATEPGMVVGIALESFAGENTTEFLNISNPGQLLSNELNGKPKEATISAEVTEATLSAESPETTPSAKNNAENSITTPTDASNSIPTGKVLVFVNLSWFPGELEANTPAQSISKVFSANNDIKLDENLILYKNLQVFGKTAVNDLFITGNLNIGLLTFDSLENSINALGTTLKLQSSYGAGDIEAFGRKIVMTTSGDLHVINTIYAKKVVTEDLVISTPTRENGSAGYAIIKRGQTSTEIKTTRVKYNSLILITPETLLDFPLAVTSKIPDNGFVVEIPRVSDKDIKFSWLVLGQEE